KISEGSITGHVGLLESIYAIAAGLGWTLEEARESPPEPILAERETPSGLGPVRAGRVIGLRSAAAGRKGGRSVVELEFVAHAGLKDERDEISIEGEPPIRQVIAGGVPGDAGTVAVTVNTIPRAVEAASGLKTMMDLALPRWVP
ncbi:MAG TPA: dihydrodipicolinate reductase, partial [Planctomycetota bacterium]|nr:dihydrodipicolinate reductase [Planctomycetota bacterium]